MSHSTAVVPEEDYDNEDSFTREDPGTDDDDVEVASSAGEGEVEGETDGKAGGWTHVGRRQKYPKKFWHPVYNRPTSWQFNGKGAAPAMMCPNRNKYGGCKTLLPCACGRIGHTARHNELATLRKDMFVMRANRVHGVKTKGGVQVVNAAEFDAHKIRKSYAHSA